MRDLLSMRMNMVVAASGDVGAKAAVVAFGCTSGSYQVDCEPV